MKILLVEDNVELNKSLKEILEIHNHLVDTAFNGREALGLLEKIEYDVIILDIMLPEIDGYGVAKLLRDKGINTPIIMLTALGELENKLRGFEIGADDYIVKPFDVQELIARINAIGRRAIDIHPDIVEINGLIIDLRRRTVLKEGKEIDITPKLFCILEQLIKNRGKVVTYETLAGKCWEAGENPSNETLRANMKLLRKIIDDKNKDLIKTLSGVGYRID